MPKPESRMRRQVLSCLKPLHGVAVENAVLPGHPDVNYAGGDIELKRVPAVRSEDAVVRVPHFSPQQRVFLTLRKRAGGRAHVLIMVGSEWILLDGLVAAQCLGTTSLRHLKHVCDYMWDRAPRPLELRRALGVA